MVIAMTFLTSYHGSSNAVPVSLPVPSGRAILNTG